MATNPYINRVDIQRGGTTETLINISDTTAVASDVAQGKYFYLASGEKVAGTSSAAPYVGLKNNEFYTNEIDERRWHVTPFAEVDSGAGDTPGYVADGWNANGTPLDWPAIPANTSITPTNSVQRIGGSGYVLEDVLTVSAVPSGTAGTPTATKGTVSNHSVSVTPSVTNATGYITGGTKTGTAVTVSASELVSGSQTKTANGTYDVTNLAELVVNVSGGSSKNVQVAQSTTRSTSTSYTEVISLTCTTAGTYDVYWSTHRTSTSGTWGSQLYLGSTAYGSAITGGWSNHIQNNHLTGVQIAANQEVSVRVRSRGSNYYGYVGTLTIVQTA